MQLKRIIHGVEEIGYPTQGNVAIPEERPPGANPYGFNSFILISGRPHPTVYSQGGKHYTAWWHYVVDHGGNVEKQVGLRISIGISGHLSNDTQGLNATYAGLDVTLEQISPGSDMLYEVHLESRRNPGGINEYPPDIVIRPLPAHPSELRLELKTTTNVVVDTESVSWAEHNSQIRIDLKPFTY